MSFGFGFALPRRRDGGGNLGELLLSQARIFVDWSDAANHSGRYAKNQNDTRTPTLNVLAMTSGVIGNEGGSSTNPPRSLYYPSLPDPLGGNNACRIGPTGATNQTLYLYRQSLNPTLPNGAYTLRFRARSMPGTGPWTLNYGLSSGYASGNTADLDWTNAANTAATTFTREFTWANSGDIAIRFAASGADVLIDCIQLYPGVTADLPAWSTEVQPGGRRAFLCASSIPLTAGNNADLTGLSAGLMVYDPAFPAKHTYSEYTIMTMNSLDSAPGASSYLVNFHTLDGGTTTGNLIMCENTSPYVGEVNCTATGSSRSKHAFNVAGKGLFVVGQSRNATTRKVYTDAAPVFVESRVFAAVDRNLLSVGSWINSPVADQRGSTALGDYAYTVVWDRQLTDDEWRLASDALKARQVARGITLMPLSDFHVFSGDSNWTRATGDWTQLISAADYLAPGANVYCAVTAVGGQGLGDIEHGDKDVWTGGITDAGRLRVTDKPIFRAEALAGRKVAYWPGMGTNDPARIKADYATYVTCYMAVVQEALDTHPNVTVFLNSILPQFGVSADPAFDAARILVNTAFSNAAAASGGRVVYCNSQNGLVEADFNVADGIHLVSTGDVKVAATNGAAIAAWRTAIGI